MNKLKKQTVNGLLWNTLDSIINQGGSFLILIILARILSPNEFGLIGLTVIFITIAQVLAEGGLGYALIRMDNCTKKDFSTVFYFNITSSLLLYIIIYFISPYIAIFFNQPILSDVIRLLAVSIIVSSVTSIQQTIIIKEINFKSQAIISFTAILISGGISVYLALRDFGVWSLVWRTLINQIIRSILLTFHNKWLPAFYFDFKSFKSMFQFGYKLMFINFLNTLSKNIYNAIIGKSYNAVTLGYYTTADNFTAMASNTTALIINKVAYPVLSKVKHDPVQLKQSAKYFLSLSMFISFALMAFLFIAVKPIISFLFGTKWLDAVPILQILCLAYIAYPAQQINQSIVLSKGRSGLLLKLEGIKYLLIVPVIFLGIKYGINVLLIGFVLHYWANYAILTYATKLTMNYSFFEQIEDSWRSAIVSFLAGFITYFITFKINTILILEIMIIFIFFLIIFILSCELIKHPIYQRLKHIVINKIWFKK